MDATIALADIRSLVRELRVQEAYGKIEQEFVIKLLDRFEPLDKWLTEGGDLPTPWDHEDDDEPEAG